jgi:hypothetical protein
MIPSHFILAATNRAAVGIGSTLESRGSTETEYSCHAVMVLPEWQRKKNRPWMISRASRTTWVRFDGMLPADASANGETMRSMKINKSAIPIKLAILCAAGIFTACGESSRPAAVAPTGEVANDVSYIFSAKGLDEKDARLIAAAGAGNLAELVRAIDEGANIDAADKLKRTAIFAAAFTNRPAVIKELAGRSARIDYKDTAGMSPLHAAVATGSGDALLALIKLRADVNVRDVSGRTPLHIAAATDQASLVDLLLTHGANPKLVDRNGMTAAALARDHGHATLGERIRSRTRS